MEWKQWINKIALLAFGIYVYVACAPVEFQKRQIPEKPPTPTCEDQPGGCVVDRGRDEYNYQFKIGYPAVDILFVNDNSGSMSFEQTDMANRFSDFMRSIEQRKLDYRIAIITTDVSASPNNPPNASNGNGKLQDGKLITFQDGKKFLTRDSKNPHAQFAAAIQRQETITCENWLTDPKTTDADRRNSALYAQKCPSGDERGIYAANLAVARNEKNWLRDGVPLAVIVLSDEDVRSFGDEYPSPIYQPENLDTAESLPKTVKAHFGNGKPLSVHSIIVKPGDMGCLYDQNRQIIHPQTGNAMMSGHVGNIYAELSRLTNGHIGDICSLNYSGEIGQIGTTIVDQTPDIPKLACSNPVNVQVSPSSARWSVSGDTLRFTQPLAPGTVVRVRYYCPR